MGDRCYIHLTCRREDQSRFEALGFQLEFEQTSNSPLIEMVDEEANYAHSGKLPTDIPYYGHHEAGGSYNAADFACDGKQYVEVDTGQDSGFVIEWNQKRQKPNALCLRRIKRYHVVLNRVENLFKTISARLHP